MPSPSLPGAFSDPSTRVRPAARRVEPREGCDLDFAGLALGFGTGFGRTTVALGGADTGFGGTGSVDFGCGRKDTPLERVLFEGGGSLGDGGNDNGDDGVSEGSRGGTLSGAGAGAGADAGAGAGADAGAGTGGRAGACIGAVGSTAVRPRAVTVSLIVGVDMAACLRAARFALIFARSDSASPEALAWDACLPNTCL
jgi:hypothetical protein